MLLLKAKCAGDDQREASVILGFSLLLSSPIIDTRGSFPLQSWIQYDIIAIEDKSISLSNAYPPYALDNHAHCHDTKPPVYIGTYIPPSFLNSLSFIFPIATNIMCTNGVERFPSPFHPSKRRQRSKKCKVQVIGLTCRYVLPCKNLASACNATFTVPSVLMFHLLYSSYKKYVFDVRNFPCSLSLCKAGGQDMKKWRGRTWS